MTKVIRIVTAGPPGPSAYATWLSEGNEGTEEEFLDQIAAHKINSDITGIPGAIAILNEVAITQANYNALATKDPNTAYLIIPAS